VTPREWIDVLLVAGALSQGALGSRERESRAEDKEECGQTQPVHGRSIARKDGIVVRRVNRGRI
jgi:hypothetical protein